MRVAILAGGSRGDYQPVIAVGRELQSRGHHVGVTASTDYAPHLRAAGLEVEEIHADAMRIYREGTVAERMAGASIGRQVGALRHQAEAMAPELARALIDLWPRYDAVVSTALTFPWAGQLAAHDPRPQVLMLFVPALPSVWGDASMFATRPGRSARNLVDGLRGLGPGMAMGSPVTDALAEHGVPRGPRLRAARHTLTVPAFIAHTPRLITPRRVSGRQIVLTGYPFRDSPPGTTLDAALEGFLADGPPPVYAGFGSQSLEQTREALRHTIEGALAAGHRVVALRGTGLAETSDERVLVVDGAPHDLLFPRVAAIAHHGGAGTTAEALRSGRPQVVLPFALDQPFFARRVHEVGAGAAPVPVGRTSVEALRRSFEATEDPALRRSAALVGDRVRAERGAAAAADRIEAALTT
ncbi:glycosyltransferase [Serinicoccus kebangsaanensis]|uniref:glycosyltransferase n=1 Tax=Serinicoccus kebangsaanensis TaxID=2602069 RepID=UPI00124E9E5D|nr:glycosyltransferase [Serinicoccus kebangsaanensis]